MTWRLDGLWTLFDGAVQVTHIEWSKARGTYVDGAGNPLPQKFEDARRACEAAAVMAAGKKKR